MELVSQLKRVADFLEAKPSQKILNDQLQVISKTGIYWVLLCLLKPFYRLIGWDIFSHVRVDAVAKQVISLCQKHKSELLSRPILIEMVKVEILNRLNSQTKGKYKKQIDGFTSELPKPPTLNPKQFRVPNNLAEPGITAAQLQSITLAFQKVQQNPFRYQLDFCKNGPKRTLRILDLWSWTLESKDIESFSVPLSLHIDPTQFILLSKKIIGKGGQTKVRLSYNLLTGETVSRKNCPDPFQQDLIRHLLGCSSPKGIVPILGIRQTKSKFQAFEQFYPDTLSSVIERGGGFPTLESKISMMGDLLEGLTSLHAMRTRLSLENNQSLSISHNDLKPANILINEGKAVITDFGSINPYVLAGTLGYRSPEKAVFTSRSSISEPDCLEFKKKEGQPSDIWAMGLIFAIILKEHKSGKFPNLCISPLKFIEDTVTRNELLLIQQQEIDETLGKEKIGAPLLSSLWNLVGRMLKVNPRERMTASEALNQLKHLHDI